MHKIQFAHRYIIVTLLVCCNLLSYSQITKMPFKDEIIIIFKHYPKNEKPFVIGKSQTLTKQTPRVSYYDTKQIIDVEINTEKQVDTVRIKVTNDIIVLLHRYNSVLKNEYLLKRGDVCLFEYKNDAPFLTILNRKTHSIDTNYDGLFRQRHNNLSVSPLDVYNYPYLSLDFAKLPHENLQEELKKESLAIKKQYLLLSNQLLAIENNYLDSLKAIEQISPISYAYYKNRNYFNVKKIEMSEGKLSIDVFENILKEYHTDSIPDFQYNTFIEKGFDIFWLSKTTQRDLKDGVNRDYREAYESIKEIKFLNEKNRNYLLYREMKRIANSFSNNDFLEYFTRFERDVTDTTYLSHIKNKYALKFNDKKNETNSLVLISSDKKQITFDDLKKRHAGKLIYVDFWASWCAPCRKALPSSIKLKDKNKDVVFVYLSMDSTIEPWEKAMADEKLNNYSESYLIVNSETSNFLKKQNVSTIPRYMIFDKMGKLAFANAPNAESKELESTFAKLLK